MTGRTERQYRRRAHYPARINFGITNELRAALEALADKADTCVAEVARDCIEASIGAVRARATDKRTAHSEPAHPGTTGRGPARGIKCEDGYDYLRQIRAELKSRIRGRRRNAIRAAGTEPAQQRRIPPRR